jgi:hypothetical protein
MNDRVYIRLGRTRRGPFTQDELHRLKSQGQFSRLHEVSSDGATWRSSEEFFRAAPTNGIAAEPAIAQRSQAQFPTASAPGTDRRLAIGVGVFFVCSLCIFLFAAAHKYGWLGRNEPAKLVAAVDDGPKNQPPQNAAPQNVVAAEPPKVDEKTRRYWEELSALVNDRGNAAGKLTLADQSKAYAALALKIKLLESAGVEVNVARHGASWEGCFLQWSQHYKAADSLPGKAGESLAEWFLKGIIVSAAAGKGDQQWADDQIRRDMAERFGRGADNILDVARRKSNLDALEASLIQEGEILARTYKL